MLLTEACDWLGWPSRDQILAPSGEGASVTAAAVQRKIENSLKRTFPNVAVETGTLSPNPHSAESDSPYAVVCEFPNGAPPEALSEAHRLAWNFSRTALLITLEPHQLIAWSCYQEPTGPDEMRRVADSIGPQDQLRDLLHWVSLATGKLIRERPKHFPADGRADQLLLKNLKYVRKVLVEQLDLNRDICHDLLARVIFTQFLFHRKDSSGAPFFSKTLLGNLRQTKVLQQDHEELGTILRDKDETYSLFRWMDTRFNGDLFPGKEDQSEEDREAAWNAEYEAVRPDHLKQLADLVSGTIDTTDRQQRLWPQYSFDTIPLEFISSVYEEFLNEDRDANKAYYTPSHLVDYVLDAVLPWGGTEFDLKILDPSCGSGIFLVKAFQRIIHRWRRANGREPRVSDLKDLLARNFCGVDINQDAVRVACFSLYLAMADAIDPKHYVTREKVFPRLRGTRLITGDFFDESIAGISVIGDAEKYDLVVGNAPWGDRSIRKTSDPDITEASLKKGRKRKATRLTKAEKWAKIQKWPVANYDIGPLFVCKGMSLLKPSGYLGLVQPASPWLYQSGKNARELREKLFSNYTVAEITNLSLLRREMFVDVIGPACVLVANMATPSSDSNIFYFTPKPHKRTGARSKSPAIQPHGFTIEPQDVSRVPIHEAINNPSVWSVLAVGGMRDFVLILRLSSYESVSKLRSQGQLLTRSGVVAGDRQKLVPELASRRYLDLPQFPQSCFLELNSKDVPVWGVPCTHSADSTDFSAFENPQALIKQSISAKSLRFRAVAIRPTPGELGVICKETYFSVNDLSLPPRHIGRIVVGYNSTVASYYLALTSSRIGNFNTETLTTELDSVPLPPGIIDTGSFSSFDQIDTFVMKAFSFNDAEKILLEDLLNVTLPSVLRKSAGKAQEATSRRAEDGSVEPQLGSYADIFARVIQSTFGKSRTISATIYQESGDSRLPVRILTIHLDWPDKKGWDVETMEAGRLLDSLSEFHRDVLAGKVRSATGDGLGFQRVAFLFHSAMRDGHLVHSLTIIKPDEYRYWTRSQGMRDADSLSAAILEASGRKSNGQ